MVGIPKPKKRDRPNLVRRREQKKKDIQFQKEAGGEGTCENCGQWKPLCGHHVKARRYGASRHDPGNALRVCFTCHNDIHSPPVSKLLAKYVVSKLRTEWEKRARVHQIPIQPA